MGGAGQRSRARVSVYLKVRDEPIAADLRVTAREKRRVFYRECAGLGDVAGRQRGCGVRKRGRVFDGPSRQPLCLMKSGVPIAIPGATRPYS